jgi:Fe-S-cluster containining protein
VAECILTIAGGDDIGARDLHNNCKKVIGLELDILGETLSFHIGVGTERAKLADIVPLARTLCTNITEVVVQRARSDGDRIPCDKGCSACCRRCLVPLSVPEALRFKEEIDAAPAYLRESVWGACLRAAKLILSQKLPKPFIHKTEVLQSRYVDLNLLSNWYTNLKLRCPFLSKHVCSIYGQRPLACREHFIKGSARACRELRGAAEVLDMPVQLPNVLGQLASELEGTGVEAVILPLSLVWFEENPERTERSWPAEMMVQRFVEIVEAMAGTNLPEVASQRQTTTGSSKTHQATNQLCRLPSG